MVLSGFESATVRSALATAQDALRPQLAALGAHVLGQYQDAYNGVKVRVALRDLARLTALPGVVSVQALPQYQMANVTSSLFTGVPAAWSVGTGLTGQGVKIAVIDTGIDYTHADFGGSGNPTDYTANDGVTLAGSGFPNAKVAGGFDFVGDAYDAGGTGESGSQQLTLGAVRRHRLWLAVQVPAHSRAAQGRYVRRLARQSVFASATARRRCLPGPALRSASRADGGASRLSGRQSRGSSRR